MINYQFLTVLATDLEAGKGRLPRWTGLPGGEGQYLYSGIFQPVELIIVLVDGAVTEQLQASIARELGAEVCSRCNLW